MSSTVDSKWVILGGVVFAIVTFYLVNECNKLKCDVNDIEEHLLENYHAVAKATTRTSAHEQPARQSTSMFSTGDDEDDMADVSAPSTTQYAASSNTRVPSRRPNSGSRLAESNQAAVQSAMRSKPPALQQQQRQPSAVDHHDDTADAILNELEDERLLTRR